jgi:O-antigen/teichoic acid export membrane protein
MFFTKNTLLILSQRAWQSFAGLVTLVAVTFFLNVEQQGWYYTFVSVAALYSVFEMGLASAVLQVSAHMFTQLSWGGNGEVVGKDQSEFNALVSKSFQIYLKLAIVFTLLAVPIGLFIFNARDGGLDIGSWRLPWMLVVFATAANMVFLPFLAIVEGSGQIQEVYFVRLLQGIFGAVGCWVALMMGGFLWAVAIVPLMGIFIGILWLYRCRPLLFVQALSKNIGNQFNWRQQIWSMQWRVGISWISIYFMSQLSTPILFFYQDAIVAGQMGLTLSIAHMIGIFSQSWMARHIPEMGMSVARKDLAALDRLFYADLKHVVFIYFLGALIVLSFYEIASNTLYIDRLLPFWQFLGLLIFVFIFQMNAALSAYLRAFKAEPLMLLNALGAVLIVGGSIFGAIQYSSTGVVCAMVLIESLLIFPFAILIWNNCRKEWRSTGHYS